MPVPVQLFPTPAGLALSALAVVLGAPLFSDGLRATRLRRRLGRVRRETIDGSTDGFVHVQGRVELESPLFAPLSGRPCAGFRLEIEAKGRPIHRHLEVRRAFRVTEAGHAARVPAASGRWVCGSTGSRTVAASDSVSANLAAMLSSIPEVVWLRRSGATLVLTERGLLSGSECHVVGVARSARAVAESQTIELERTGTDDLLVVSSAGSAPGAAASHEAEVAFPAGENEDFLLVSDREPRAEHLQLSSLREIGLVLGPLLTLTGLFYLAALADALRAGARM